jgi:hypothetical protein
VWGSGVEACDLLATRDDAVRDDSGSRGSSAKLGETVRHDLSVRKAPLGALVREGHHGGEGTAPRMLPRT